MQAPRKGRFLFRGGEQYPLGASTAFSSVILSLSLPDRRLPISRAGKGDIGMRWSSASLRQAQTDKLGGGGIILKPAWQSNPVKNNLDSYFLNTRSITSCSRSSLLAKVRVGTRSVPVSSISLKRVGLATLLPVLATISALALAAMQNF